MSPHFVESVAGWSFAARPVRGNGALGDSKLAALVKLKAEVFN